MKPPVSCRGPVPMDTDAAPPGGTAEAALPAPPPKAVAGPASVVLPPAPEPEVPKLPPIDREKVCYAALSVLLPIWLQTRCCQAAAVLLSLGRFLGDADCPQSCCPAAGVPSPAQGISQGKL